ncbi:MAG: DUF4159 domain-containing protein [Sphingobacteriia bacterium]|nr:DUF4159 domain-containing protein [Sphingobacteriia bacterium]
MRFLLFFWGGISLFPLFNWAQDASFKVGKLKYEGGGDWYANPTSLPNLFKFIRQQSSANIGLSEEVIDLKSPQLFQFPMIYMTGHGNVIFSQSEALQLREYLLAGGFFHIDDNYGMDPYIRREMKKVFPELEFVEVPFSHPIYHQHFDFPNGLPKVHEHNGKPPQGFGLFWENRLICFYTFECDLGDGWEDKAVHNDPEGIRQKALQMGTNIVLWAVTH